MSKLVELKELMNSRGKSDISITIRMLLNTHQVKTKEPFLMYKQNFVSSKNKACRHRVFYYSFAFPQVHYILRTMVLYTLHSFVSGVTS